MMQAWALVLADWQEALFNGFVVFLRVGALVAVLPVFGEQSVPQRVRLALALAFTMVVTPTIAPSIVIDPAIDPRTGALLLTEVAAGLFWGLLLRFFVIALQVAGAIAAQATSLSQIFGGTAGMEPQPAIGQVLYIAGLAIAASLHLHVMFARYIIQSYTLTPMGLLIDANDVNRLGLSVIAEIFALGFRLAAPFVIASLLYNLVLGVINRAMPQLMVSFVGAPAITAAGLLILTLSAPIALAVWADSLFTFMGNPTGPAR